MEVTLKYLFALLAAAAAGMSGWLTGWMIGASTSPVVAGALPLLFGVLAAAGIWKGGGGAWSSVEGGQSLGAACVGMFCLLTFVTTTWLGCQAGIEKRVGVPEAPSRTTVETLTGKPPLDDAHARIALQEYHWALADAGLGREEQKQLLAFARLRLQAWVEQRDRLAPEAAHGDYPRAAGQGVPGSREQVLALPRLPLPGGDSMGGEPRAGTGAQVPTPPSRPFALPDPVAPRPPPK